MRFRRASVVGMILLVWVSASLMGSSGVQSAGARPTITATPGVSSTATVVPTAGGRQEPFVFLLYAARVTTVGGKPDLTGLAAVQPGTTVWLMMYFVAKNIPKVLSRTTRYTVEYQGKPVFDASFPGTLLPTDAGKAARYVSFTLPASQPLGQYVFRATLTIGGKQQTKTWRFAVATHARRVTTGAATPSPQASFLLYAARVSTVNIQGDLTGLTAVHRGMTVWLMMFYVVKRVPQTMHSTARYIVLRRGKAVFRATVRGEVAPADAGRLFVHTIYTVPPSMPYGDYTFRATLSIGGKRETKTWRFVVATW